MDPLEVKRKIERADGLTTTPGVARQALQLMRNPQSSVGEISDFIANDPALAARVLKVINSPLYGFPHRISAVNQAVLLLGLNMVRALLASVTAFDLMKATVGLWEHSVGCAVVARLIARTKGLKDPEDCSSYGLLHDIGKVILLLQFPSEYEGAVSDARAREVSISRAETDHFSADHAIAGAWVAERWNFPRDFVEVIRYHHTPALARSTKYQTAIVHLADVLIRARGFGFAGDHFVPPVEPTAWELIDLSLQDLRHILKETEILLEDARDLEL